MRVGFAGLGHMGMPMARNLLRAGFEVWVWNRTRSKAEALAREGARIADSPAHLARETEVTLACLADVPAVEAVFLGPDGLVEGVRPGQVLADHSTVGPETTRRVYEAVRARGAWFLDAPISGGPEGARNATLTIMVGGDAPAFEKALPAFRAMGRRVEHMGPSGAGTATKLANQLLVGVHTLASCEAVLLARRAGVDLDRLLEVLMASWGASRMLERNLPRLRDRDFGPSPAPLRHLVKDLGLVADLARQVGLPVPLTKEALALYRRAYEQGLRDHDLTAVARLLEEGLGTP